MILDHAERIDVDRETSHSTDTEASVVMGQTVEDFVGESHRLVYRWESASRGIVRAVLQHYRANRHATFAVSIPGVGTRVAEYVEAPTVRYSSPGAAAISLALRTTIATD